MWLGINHLDHQIPELRKQIRELEMSLSKKVPAPDEEEWVMQDTPDVHLGAR
tara:strand:+ start:2981 stop:3136 length:156 start_codon:yes stop_codon:yes gene_type:complete